MKLPSGSEFLLWSQVHDSPIPPVPHKTLIRHQAERKAAWEAYQQKHSGPVIVTSPRKTWPSEPALKRSPPVTGTRERPPRRDRSSLRMSPRPFGAAVFRVQERICMAKTWDQEATMETRKMLERARCGVDNIALRIDRKLISDVQNRVVRVDTAKRIQTAIIDAETAYIAAVQENMWRDYRPRQHRQRQKCCHCGVELVTYDALTDGKRYVHTFCLHKIGSGRAV